MPAQTNRVRENMVDVILFRFFFFLLNITCSFFVGDANVLENSELEPKLEKKTAAKWDDDDDNDIVYRLEVNE